MAGNWAVRAAVAVWVWLSAAVAQGATITGDVALTASASLFGGAPIGDFQIGPDSFGVRSLAEVHYQARASAGSVEAAVQGRLQVEHPDVVTFSAAAMTPVSLSFAPFVVDLPAPLPDLQVPGAIGSFQTAFGVEAEVEVELFGAADLRLLNIDGFLETSGVRLLPFGETVSADDEERIAQAGRIYRDPWLGTRWGARATVDAVQESELVFGDLLGTVHATHEDGTLVTRSFAFDEAESVLLDLQRPGLWQLALGGITVEGDFASEFGIEIGGRACVVVCAGISSGFLPIGSSRFDLDFSQAALTLATVRVLPEGQVVPLPAGLPLLVGALGSLALLRRRRPAGRGRGL